MSYAKNKLQLITLDLIRDIKAEVAWFEGERDESVILAPGSAYKKDSWYFLLGACPSSL